jgi:hypothetical protein
VDTDGRVRVLFPSEPWEDNFARGGREFEVDGRASGGDAFTIDDYPGVGYLFAVASADPFVYDGIESGDHWDYRVIADGRVRGDPYVALTDLAQRIVPEGYSDWDYDIVSYNVERHYDYPRFLCYDCHTYVSYPGIRITTRASVSACSCTTIRGTTRTATMAAPASSSGGPTGPSPASFSRIGERTGPAATAS